MADSPKHRGRFSPRFWVMMAGIAAVAFIFIAQAIFGPLGHTDSLVCFSVTGAGIAIALLLARRKK
ncbi:unannotated protein [freshwater metagenome]|uniref:Unannotated protein n=1 Tax=freshwater metagenome TaxID=449393 RepID=A0A6J7KLW4_9ZZZZ|nr:hypothetical protein [Actinomycetota bacterium]